jgi:hypothetical protein
MSQLTRGDTQQSMIHTRVWHALHVMMRYLQVCAVLDRIAGPLCLDPLDLADILAQIMPLKAVEKKLSESSKLPVARPNAKGLAGAGRLRVANIPAVEPGVMNWAAGLAAARQDAHLHEVVLQLNLRMCLTRSLIAKLQPEAAQISKHIATPLAPARNCIL